MYPIYVLLISTSPQISLRFAIWPVGFELQAILRQVHQMPPKWPWTPQGQMYQICATSVPNSQISVRSTLRSAVFEIRPVMKKGITKLSIIGKHQMTSEWPWTLNIQKCPAYIKYLSRCPNFCQIFHSKTNYFQETRFFKIGKIRNTPNDIRLYVTIKNTLCILTTYHRDPNFHPFALWPAVFKIQGWWK